MKNKILLPILAFALLFFSCNIQAFNGSPAASSSRRGARAGESAFDSDAQVSNLRGSEAKYTDRIRITWDAFDGADYYAVMRANLNTNHKPSLDSDVVKNASFEQIGTVFSSSSPYFEDKSALNSDPNTFYAYAVTAISLSKKASSSRSEIVYGSYLVPPSGLKASKGESDTEIFLEFEQSPGASGYLIYKSENPSDLSMLSPVGSYGYFTDETARFPYTVEDSEKGKSLYFAVRSVSSDNARSEISESRIGYTSVQGAPDAVTLAENSKGKDPKAIKISFFPSDPSDDVRYQIYKSYSGGAETLILDTGGEQGDKLGEDKDKGVQYFTDFSVAANIVYTYNIVPSNDLGIGKPLKVESYLLSPVKSVALTPVRDGGKFGYQLSVNPPLGFDEVEGMCLSVTDVRKSGVTNITRFSYGDTLPFYDVNPNYETDDEIRSVSVTVENADSSTSAKTDSVLGIPAAPVLTTDGRNIVRANANGKIMSVANEECSGECTGEKYHNGTVCHEIGAFPIVIGWKETDDAYLHRVVRNDGKEIVELTENRIEDAAVEIGKTYSYTIYAEDRLGRKSTSVKASGCFPAMTAAQFASEYERHIAKPFYFQDEHPEYAKGKSKGAIWGYIREGRNGLGSGALGSASARDSFLGKTISYNAKMNGIGGIVTFVFEAGFGESPDIHMVTSNEAKSYGLSGVSVTEQKAIMDTDSGGTGTYYCDNGNKHYIGGKYGLAIIDIEEVRTQSKALAGRYSVTQTFRNENGEEFKTSAYAYPLTYEVTN